jgi:hypothetical protein
MGPQPTGPLDLHLDRGTQHTMAGGALSPVLYKEVGTGGTHYKVLREPYTPPTHPTDLGVRSSDGKHCRCCPVDTALDVALHHG